LPRNCGHADRERAPPAPVPASQLGARPWRSSLITGKSARWRPPTSQCLGRADSAFGAESARCVPRGLMTVCRGLCRRASAAGFLPRWPPPDRTAGDGGLSPPPRPAAASAGRQRAGPDRHVIPAAPSRPRQERPGSRARTRGAPGGVRAHQAAPGVRPSRGGPRRHPLATGAAMRWRDRRSPVDDVSSRRRRVPSRGQHAGAAAASCAMTHSA